MAHRERSKRARSGSNGDARAGRLRSRPRAAPRGGPGGLHSLRLGRGRDGLLYAPSTDPAGPPAPLIVLLHGAGADARDIFPVLQDRADLDGFTLLTPDSRAVTWDVVLGAYGPDVAFLDRALDYTFDRHTIDSTRVAVGGFSDGASYALSLGIANGDLFTHVIAFSPGFIAPAAQRGSPRVFISHGTADRVLPIDVCSRRIVRELQRAEYDVRYDEFEGGHTIPERIAGDAIDWFLDPVPAQNPDAASANDD